MKLKEPVIALQRGSPFEPGDLLQGSASWRFESPIKVKHVRLLFSGNCKVKWKTGSGDDEKTYKSREVYFQHFITLLGNADGQEISIAPGQFRKPFQFQLPTNLPSSFSSTYGNVWYSISLQAEYSGVFASDNDYTVYFRVVNPTVNHTQRPLRMAQEGVDTGCFGGSSMIKFDIMTNKSMYNPGEVIVLNGYVMNGSSESLQKVKMVVKQKISFFGRRTGFFGTSGSLKCKQKSYVISEWRGEHIAPRGTLNLNDRATVTIPDVGESNLRHCQFIDVDYVIKFKVMPSGFCSEEVSSGPVEVMIGNQLSRTTVENSNVIPSAPPDVFPNLEPSAIRIDVTDTAPPYSSVPESTPVAPPSYNEAVSFSAVPPPNPIPTINQSYNQPSTTTTQGNYYDWSQSAFTYS